MNNQMGLSLSYVRLPICSKSFDDGHSTLKMPAEFVVQAESASPGGSDVLFQEKCSTAREAIDRARALVREDRADVAQVFDSTWTEVFGAPRDIRQSTSAH